MTISQMNFFERIVYLLQQYGPSYLRGAGSTLLIAAVSTAIGCLIGFVVGVIRTIPVDKKRDGLAKKVVLGIVKAVLKGYVELFRGTPMIVQAAFIYYGMSQVFDIQLGVWSSAFLVVSVNTGAYMAESVRGGIISVNPGQTEGAKAIGMDHVQTMRYVILPQAFRNIMPQIGNNLIINLKDTSVLFSIGIMELFSVHRSVSGALYTYFESATIVMVIYLIMTIVCSRLLLLWERRMDGEANYELVDAMGIGDQLRNPSDVAKRGDRREDR